MTKATVTVARPDGRERSSNPYVRADDMARPSNPFRQGAIVATVAAVVEPEPVKMALVTPTTVADDTDWSDEAKWRPEAVTWAAALRKLTGEPGFLSVSDEGDNDEPWLAGLLGFSCPMCGSGPDGEPAIWVPIERPGYRPSAYATGPEINCDCPADQVATLITMAATTPASYEDLRAKVGTNEPIVDGMLWTKSMAWLSGAPEAGKSFTAMQLAGCVTNGMPFLGHETAPGNVVYLAAEAPETFEPRAKAWEALNGVSIGLDGPTAAGKRLYVLTELAHGWDAFVSFCKAVSASVVVIDTQYNVVDEMSRSDVRAFIGHLEAIAANGAATLTLHHPTGDGDKRTLGGLSELRRAAAVVWFLRKVKSVRRLVCDKNRLGSYFEPVTFDLVQSGPSVAVQMILGPQSPRPESGLKIGPKETKFWQAWWTESKKEDIEISGLLALSQESKGTTYRRINALVSHGIADLVSEYPQKTWRLNRRPDDLESTESTESKTSPRKSIQST